MSGPKFQLGDIVNFLMPHTDGTASTSRPGLVVGDPLDNQNRDYVVVQITTQTWSGKSDVWIEDGDAEFTATGLEKSSTIRCHKIFAVGETRVQRRRGCAGPKIMARVQPGLRHALRL